MLALDLNVLQDPAMWISAGWPLHVSMERKRSTESTFTIQILAELSELPNFATGCKEYEGRVDMRSNRATCWNKQISSGVEFHENPNKISTHLRSHQQSYFLNSHSHICYIIIDPLNPMRAQQTRPQMHTQSTSEPRWLTMVKNHANVITNEDTSWSLSSLPQSS